MRAYVVLNVVPVPEFGPLDKHFWLRLWLGQVSQKRTFGKIVASDVNVAVILGEAGAWLGATDRV